MDKIVGNVVGIPNPQPDWLQTDETKADYIKNKPDLNLLSYIDGIKYYGDANIVPTEESCFTIDSDPAEGIAFVNLIENDNVENAVIPYKIIEEIDVGVFKELVVTEFKCHFCNKLKSVIIPNIITKIGGATFYYCPVLEEVVIPDSVVSIAENAFNGCDKVVIYCNAGSYAEQYAIENGIAYKSKAVYVDQTYDPESENAQSGKAVAEALTHKITELYVNPIGYDCYIPEPEGSTTIFNMTINNGAIFYLPYNENNTFYQLLIHADVSVNNASINWNTYRFFNGEIPDIGIGKYDFIFEWDGTEWCAGAIAKGVVE